MSNDLWDYLESQAARIQSQFDRHLVRYEDSTYNKLSQDPSFEGWSDLFWTSSNIRKAHLKTVRSKGMWLLHVNVFPVHNANLPIVGFDIVANRKKVSGAFFDFSPIHERQVKTNPLIQMFKSKVATLDWSSKRDLPDWAQNIFSDDMVAVNNLKEGEELDSLFSAFFALLELFLEQCDSSLFVTENTFKDGLNKYCQFQRQNKHLHNAIRALGISDKNRETYINRVLFEYI